jgi:hypothetical protein
LYQNPDALVSPRSHFKKNFSARIKKLEIKSNQPVSILETAKISGKVFLLDSKKFF